VKIKIEKITDWDLVYRMALKTQNKKPKKQFPSEEWKRKTIKAQHSPLRCLQFIIEIDDIPNFVHMHLVRHVHLIPFIASNREDITGVPNEEVGRLTPTNGAYLINAQEFLNVSYLRLCNKASKETRIAWNMVVKEMCEIEPLLYDFAVPNCVRLGYCPEYKSCEFVDSENYKVERTKYLSDDKL
jgi:hypothetical protein